MECREGSRASRVEDGFVVLAQGIAVALVLVVISFCTLLYCSHDEFEDAQMDARSRQKLRCSMDCC